jgi:hypothetical protein
VIGERKDELWHSARVLRFLVVIEESGRHARRHVRTTPPCAAQPVRRRRAAAPRGARREIRRPALAAAAHKTRPEAQPRVQLYFLVL